MWLICCCEVVKKIKFSATERITTSTSSPKSHISLNTLICQYLSSEGMKTVIIWYFLRIYQINPNKRSRKLCFFLPQKGRRALLVIMCFPSLKLSHLHSCPQLQIGKIGKYENAFDNVTRNPNPMSLIPFTDTTDEMWNFTFKAQMLNFHTFDIEHICFFLAF